MRNFIQRLSLMILAVAVPAAVIAAPVGAVDIFKRDVCEREGSAVVCKDHEGTDSNPIYGRNGILTSVIKILSSIVGIVAVITIILAGLKYITSGSNPQDVNNARERIIYAVVALLLAVSAQALVQFVLNKL